MEENANGCLKRFCRIAVMIVFAWSGLSSVRAHAQTLKVLSLDMNNEITVEDKDYRFRDPRYATFVDWIRKNDPDIILLQEGYNYHGYGSVVKALGEELGYDYAYRIGMGFPLIMYDSNGILAKKKFHLSQERDVKLPHSAPSIGDGKNWILVFGAGTWTVGARLLLEDQKPLYVYTSHLIGNSQQDRDDQMWGIDQTIRKHVARNGEDYDQARILVSGDFNSDPSAPGIQKLLSWGYRDTFAEAHPGDKACSNCANPNSNEFNPMTIAPGQFPVQDSYSSNNRIDFLFGRGPGMSTLASTLTFTAPINGLWMSDHMGVYSTLAFGEPSDAAPVPNPVRDREDLGRAGQVVHVTDQLLQCQASSIELVLTKEEHGTSCDFAPFESVSWERGMTFINDTKSAITVRIRPRYTELGRVWARQHADLGPGKSAAFFFSPGDDFELGIRGGGHMAFSTLHSDLF